MCCSAWTGDADKFANLTVKKIPRAVRDRCEFGKDDYSLNVASLGQAEPSPPPAAPVPSPARKAKDTKTIDMFAKEP